MLRNEVSAIQKEWDETLKILMFRRRRRRCIKKCIVFRLKAILSTLNGKMCAAFKYSVRIYYKLIEITFEGILLLMFDASTPHVRAHLYNMHIAQCTLHGLEYSFVIYIIVFNSFQWNVQRKHIYINEHDPYVWVARFSFSFYPRFSHSNGNTLKSIQRRQRSSTVFVGCWIFSIIGYSNANVSNKKIG